MTGSIPYTCAVHQTENFHSHAHVTHAKAPPVGFTFCDAWAFFRHPSAVLTFLIYVYHIRVRDSLANAMSNQRRTASFCVVLLTLLSYHHSSLVPHLYQQLRDPANEIVPVKMSTSDDGLRDSMSPSSDQQRNYISKIPSQT
jgi:hypothetical protein